ncbi:MAG TPA: phospholipid scramblase-related protein, partial [bacterium]|nr:phospholipid scramblase-related protein [bacterium]
GFKQKFFSIGGRFSVLDKNDRPVCVLQGKWTSWDFRFVEGDTEYASVSKKWAGIGKEPFTSADNYMLQINSNVPADSDIRKLILAAVMCIDMVLKE